VSADVDDEAEDAVNSCLGSEDGKSTMMVVASEVDDKVDS
jgi:hypothetical protein